MSTAPGATPTVVVDRASISYRTPFLDCSSSGGVRGAAASAWQRVLGRAGMVEVRAVQGASLVAYQGEVLGLIGGNGSGKSTLLRAIAGLVPLSAGSVWVGGEVRLLGVNAALIPELSGERNVYLGGLAHGTPPARVRTEAEQVIEFADIGEAIHRPMRTYSSGMGARLRFAIATAFEPDVLLVDEALGTGDADFRSRSEARLAQLRERAGSVIFVSHSLGSVASLCDRVIWIHEGRTRMDGDPGEVLEAYRSYHRELDGARRDGRPRPCPPPPLDHPFVR